MPRQDDTSLAHRTCSGPEDGVVSTSRAMGSPQHSSDTQQQGTAPASSMAQRPQMPDHGQNSGAACSGLTISMAPMLSPPSSPPAFAQAGAGMAQGHSGIGYSPETDTASSDWSARILEQIKARPGTHTLTSAEAESAESMGDPASELSRQSASTGQHTQAQAADSPLAVPHGDLLWSFGVPTSHTAAQPWSSPADSHHPAAHIGGEAGGAAATQPAADNPFSPAEDSNTFASAKCGLPGSHLHSRAGSSNLQDRLRGPATASAAAATAAATEAGSGACSPGEQQQE